MSVERALSNVFLADFETFALRLGLVFPMSDHAHSATAEHHSAATEIPFDRAELEQFDLDDVEAGQGIGKMLSLFFFYTVIVMSLSGYITWKWIVR